MTAPPSISELARDYAYRTYEESSEAYEKDLSDIVTTVVSVEHDEYDADKNVPVTFGEQVGPISAFVARKALERGFFRGYDAQQARVDAAEDAYVTSITKDLDRSNQLSIYAQIINAIENRLNEDDARQNIPLHIQADLSQIIFEGTLELTAE